MSDGVELPEAPPLDNVHPVYLLRGAEGRGAWWASAVESALDRARLPRMDGHPTTIG